MGYIYKNLTPDEVTQLEFQAGNLAARKFDAIATEEKETATAMAVLNTAVFSVDTKGAEKMFSTVGDNAYINANTGARTEITGDFWATDYISVTAGQKLMFLYPYYNQSAIRLLPIGYAFYDSNKDYVSGQVYLPDVLEHTEDVVITAPATAAYVRFTIDEAIHGNDFYVANVVTISLKQYVDTLVGDCLGVLNIVSGETTWQQIRDAIASGKLCIAADETEDMSRATVNIANIACINEDNNNGLVYFFGQKEGVDEPAMISETSADPVYWNPDID